MKKLIIFILLPITNLFAQENWQQEVNYQIQVSLNDQNHSLSAYEEIEYINNSPKTLDSIVFHLWPNAYKNKKTALAKQLYKDGKGVLYYGEENVHGFIDSLDFKVNDQKITWKIDPKNIDIAVLYLNQALKPNETIKISTPFYVKIPSAEVSRLGHVGQSYQITQWYPKPAVFDKNGWNAMPYLNQGEFYSEFGSFDVEITLPQNYVVGATGDLMTESELSFLEQKVKQSSEEMKNYYKAKFYNFDNDNFPSSEKETKTIRYVQNNVHDFAWFADKRYFVSKGEVLLPHSKRKVTTWAMWVPENTPLWQFANQYIQDGLHYYSLWNGDYPYNNCTAVDGTISAGGGMEYPTITVIGQSYSKEDLEVVIVHEVGHNWFYGILGSNERVHGWMDEGINTLNEMRYIETKYPDNKRLSDRIMKGKFHMNDLDYHDQGDLPCRLIASLGEDQAIETHSADFAPMNYGMIMYQKTGLVFHYLKDYLGEEKFDKAMQSYFDQWKFKHPQPKDMQNALESSCGENLDWIFKDLIQTTKQVDYKIKHVKTKNNETIVKVKSVGEVLGPIEVNLINENKTMDTKWSQAGQKKSSIIFKDSIPFDRISIDADKQIPEMYRHNNNWKAKGLFHKAEPIKFELLLGDNEQNKNEIFYSLALGGNQADKFMLGLALHNYTAPRNKFEYFVAPMYSFGRKMVSGIAELNYNLVPRGSLKTSRFGISIKSFKFDTLSSRASDNAYLAYSPFWTAKLGTKNKTSPFTHAILIQGILRQNIIQSKIYDEYYGAFVKYEADLYYPDHRLNFQLRNDFIKNPNTNISFSRLLFESTYQLKYLRNKMERWIELRGFVGINYFQSQSSVIFNQSSNYSNLMAISGSDGNQDLFFEEYYFSRNNYVGNQNVMMRNDDMGGFKSNATISTGNFLATLNLFAQLPIPKVNFIGVFADHGFMNKNTISGVKTELFYNIGMALKFKNIVGVYFPFVSSSNLFFSANYLENIRFTLRFNPVGKSLNLGNIFK